MSNQLRDAELVGSYARAGSESAFGTLVARYVDLVYATALRQAGDPGMAEEITQNVFVALAKKAPRLAGMETLAGWLHRTAVLEAKARLRSEFRRLRREQTAAALAEVQSAGAESAAGLLPLLDEALLSLSGSERELVLSRFVEQRTLREAGAAIGIGEEAARKRVSRSLEKLARFFQKRGFAAPGTGAAVLAAASHKASASLAAAVSQATCAAGMPAAGLNLLWLNFMNLSKSTIAIACLLAASAPLLWQQQTVARAARQAGEANARLELAADELAATRARISRTEAERERLQVETAAAIEARRALQTQLPPADGAPSPAYHWSDAAALVRIPKDLVRSMHLAVVADRNGRLLPELQQVLQMSDRESAEVQTALQQFLADVRAAQQRVMKPVEPSSRELNGRRPEDVRVFQIGDLGEQLDQLRRDLLSELDRILGPERYEIVRDGLRYFMPMEGDSMVAGSMAFFEGEHRLYFVKPQPGNDDLQFGMTKPGSGMTGSMTPAEVPGIVAPYLQDWLGMVQQRPPELPERHMISRNTQPQ